MRKFGMVCFFLVSVAPVWGYTPAETNAVVEAMLLNYQLAPGMGDVIEIASESSEDGGWIECEFQTYEDLFTANIGTNFLGWTTEERRSAFESFLWHIPDFSTNGEYRMIVPHGRIALEYCMEFGQTNCLPAAMRIMASPQSRFKSTAREVFRMFARPSDTNSLFVASLTAPTEDANRIWKQSYLVGAYGDVLLRHCDACEPSVFSNAVKTVYKSITGKENAKLLDKLLMRVSADYAMSSNRLNHARNALAAIDSPGPTVGAFVLDYFTPITNALLNASEPLKVLDLSWLEEPMTSGNAGNGNEQEEQEGNNE